MEVYRRLRDVISDKTFDEQAGLISQGIERFDEILRAVEWAISVKAESHPVIPGTTLRIVKTDPFPGAPAVRVFFSITDENKCTMHWIELAETEDEIA